jgi:hypothetical protein
MTTLKLPKTATACTSEVTSPTTGADAARRVPAGRDHPAAVFNEAKARRAIAEALEGERKAKRTASQKDVVGAAPSNPAKLLGEADLSIHRGRQLLKQILDAGGAAALLDAVEQTSHSLRRRGLPADAEALHQLQHLAADVRRVLQQLRAR